MKLNVKRAIFVAFILFLFVLLPACSSGNVVMPFKYNPDLKRVNIKSETVAENDKYQLNWDSENRRVVLVDKADGYVWSNIPNELLSVDIDPADEFNSILAMYSPITIECIRNETYEIREAFAIEAIKSGDFSVSKIEGGVRVTYIFEKYKISVPVQYLLFDDGLRINVLTSNIAEDGGEYFLHTVSAAPFMCSAKNMTDGAYLFYPSGSGALIRMDTENDLSMVYSADIYGRDKMSDIKTWCEESNTEDIRMPVYGSKTGDRGMFAVIEKGAESASLLVEAHNRNVGYSSVYPQFAVRGETNISNAYLQSADNSMKYADAFALSDITVAFYPLTGESASYTGMSKIYRNYLESKGMVKKEIQTYLAVKFLGGDMIDTNVLGVPTKEFFATTTVDEVKDIVKELNEFTAKNLLIDLVGFGKTGFEISEVAGGFSIASKLGGEKKVKELGNDGKNIYVLDFDVLGINANGSGYSTTFDVAVAVTKQRFALQRYDIATGNNGGTLCYLISRSLLPEVCDKMIDYSKKLDLKGVALDTLSNYAYSDYNNQDYYSKGNMGKDVSAILKKVKSNDLFILTNDANDYAAMNSDAVLDVPLQTSRSDLFDDEIPFYQMVFRGYIPLYSPSVNLTNYQDELLLKAVEAGVGISYTFSNNHDTALRKKENFYQFTVYEDLKESVIKNYNDISGYLSKVGDSTINEHRVIEEGLHETVFSNGLTVYVNYTYGELQTPIGAVGPKSYVYKTAE